jgi:hypothetical protein
MPLLENTGFKHKEKPVGIVIPYQQAVLNKISSILAKYNIKTIHIPVKKYIHKLTPIKDKLGLKVGGIYCIPCKCSKVYVGQKQIMTPTSHQCLALDFDHGLQVGIEMVPGSSVICSQRRLN